MRMPQMLLFFAVFLLVTGLVSFYIYIRGLQAIPRDSSLRNAYTIIFWIIAVSFIAGRLLENVAYSVFSDVLVWMGSFWIAAMIYFLIAVVVLDLVRLANYLIPFYPAALTANYAHTKYITGAAVVGFVGIILLAGHLNSLLPRTVDLSLTIPRKSSRLRDLNIVAASDIHLGTIVGRARFDSIVERINRLDPDIVLLPGDIVDEDLKPVIRQNLGESLRSIKSRYGVFAITGNHEYIGGVEAACRYLVEHNIMMLRDQSVRVADSFYLIGRDDRSRARFARLSPRKELSQLMETVDRNYPVILMDHQPFELDQASSQGIDLQISGHTHNGQLWPVNYVVQRIYELPWGYMKKANTHYYVSDGVGTWGPPVRTGNRPEIVHIRLHFE